MSATGGCKAPKWCLVFGGRRKRTCCRLLLGFAVVTDRINTASSKIADCFALRKRPRISAQAYFTADAGNSRGRSGEVCGGVCFAGLAAASGFESVEDSVVALQAQLRRWIFFIGLRR